MSFTVWNQVVSSADWLAVVFPVQIAITVPPRVGEDLQAPGIDVAIIEARSALPGATLLVNTFRDRQGPPVPSAATGPVKAGS